MNFQGVDVLFSVLDPCVLQFVIILLLVFVTEVLVVVLGYVYRAKVSFTSFGKYWRRVKSFIIMG